ncbi:MAG: MFS transporter [Liquorilactobacillus sp.]|uniref:MFS transporter n=2 Tax=Liquorilactobacillus sp. TaxID=2767923 RepID=UPI0039E8F7E2
MEIKNKKNNSNSTVLNKHLFLIMTISGALIVANIYYIQPLLAQIAQYYHVSKGYSSLLATLTQVGYALGLLMILPLADIIEKRKLILTMLLGAAFFLLLLFFSPTILIALIASFGIGFCSVVPQLLIPLAVQLSKPNERGKIIGSLIGGLLIGILLSRVVSGFVGKYTVWKNMYFIAACLMFLLWIGLRFSLPKNYGDSSVKYSASLTSMVSLIKRFSVLRTSAIVGAMSFLAFSSFWTALTFLLQGQHYHLGSDATGLFGLVGIVGALFSKTAGKLSDKKGTRFTIGLNILITIAAYIVFSLWGFQLWGLILGVILLDLGVQSNNVSNQARIHQLGDQVRNRVTSVYMVSYFLGGALGSWLGAFSFQYFGWLGVCAVGLVSQIIAGCVHLRKYKPI